MFPVLTAALQIDITSPQTAGAGLMNFAAAQLWLQELLFGLLGLLIIIIVIALIRRRLHLSVAIRNDARNVVLRIKVPKEVKQEDVEHAKSLEQTQELIGFTETIFQTVGGLKPHKGFFAWLAGRNDKISFEMVAHKGLISFYVGCPRKQRDFIEAQIHAQYPHAEISEDDDYNLFAPNSVILASYLTFKRPSYFPIKTYKKMESDPLNTITNSLSKIGEKDGAAIQFIIRPGDNKWRRESLRIAREMQQGKKYTQVNKGFASQLGKETMDVLRGPKDKDKDTIKEYKLSPLEEEMVKGLEEKASKAGLEVNIRVVTSSDSLEVSKGYLDDLLNAFGQYSIFEYGNSFSVKSPRSQGQAISFFIHRHFDRRFKLILNSEELASLYHYPLSSTETPKIDWLLARKTVPPSNLPNQGILLGVSEYRNHIYEIRMKDSDRRRHSYIIGKSGGGKSVLQKSLIKQDIENGKGVCVIDPHGDLAEECLEFVPKERAEDVIFFNPADFERPIGLNMLDFDPSQPYQKTFAVEEMLKIFDQLYDLKSTGGPMFEQYMRNALMLIMDDPESGSTLLDVPKVLADEDYRKFKISKCKTPTVRDFWTKEAQKAGGEASLQNMVPYITSKLTPFVANDFIRPVISQQKSAFNFRQVMDEGKLLFCSLNKGKLGDISAYLIGMIVVGKLLMAALSRTDMDPSKRKDFYLYIDEFQNFLTDSITAILSEARKYGLNLVIAHQFIGQLTRKGGDTQIRDAIFGNVGTMMAFRVGPDDAEFLEKEFSPVLSKFDLMNTEAYTVSIKMLIDNTATKAFNMKTIQPSDGNKELANMIKELSRYKYGRKREIVEMEMMERYATLERTMRDKEGSL
ncbi:MAG: type IV secretion system DNA-binding domain-containing protein [Patescibacteria group bacterium]|nr:type IV secretion system DNA-binding domain-containing protein [Patescibacteria group bacterium]